MLQTQLQFDADNLSPGVVRELYQFDRLTNELDFRVIFPVPRSQVDVVQSTVTLNSSSDVVVYFDITANFAVSRPINLRDVLLTQNDVIDEIDEFTVSSTNVIRQIDLGSDKIGPQQGEPTEPPVHPLLKGNPAIDGGDPLFNGTVDQRGNLRNVADVGAVEASSGIAAGIIYADLNQDVLPRSTSLRGSPP